MDALVNQSGIGVHALGPAFMPGLPTRANSNQARFSGLLLARVDPSPRLDPFRDQMLQQSRREPR